MNTKDDILIQLLKKVAPDTPGPEFTDTIIELLEVDVEKELNADARFTDLINRSEAIDMHDNLTEKVLLSFDASDSNIKLLPLIRKRTGLFFVFLMLTLIGLSFFVKRETTEGSKGYSLSFLYEWLHNSSQNLSILFISIISVCSLLLIDYAVKNILIKNDVFHS